MVRVLVTGANGYIGKEQVIALTRAGHKVFGVVRDSKHSSELQRLGATPIVGDLSDTKSLQKVVDDVSVVIDNVMALGDVAANKALVSALGASAARQSVRKRYIYTSGGGVYAHTPVGFRTEEEPADSSAGGFLSKRVAFEQEVIKSTEVDGVVVRPMFCYGGSGGQHTATYFEAKGPNDSIVYNFGDKAYYSWIHVTDLADAYLRVVEAPRALVAGEIFDVADDTRASQREVVVACARVAGIRGEVVEVENKSPFAQLFNKRVVAKADKIKRVLGWAPKHGPLLDSLPELYATYLAHKADKSSSSQQH